MQDFYFIVAFAIPAGKESAFQQEFSAIVARMQQVQGAAGALYEVSDEVEKQLLQVPGISAALQNRPEGKADFRFCLIAHWESLELYLAALQAAEETKPISFPAYAAYYSLAKEYGSAKQISPSPAGFTFINPFEITADQDEEFQQQWSATIEQLHKAEGFIAARLYAVNDAFEAQLLDIPRIAGMIKNRANGQARFRYVWVSQWETVAQYETAVRAFGRGKPIMFPSHPAFYRNVTW